MFIFFFDLSMNFLITASRVFSENPASRKGVILIFFIGLENNSLAMAEYDSLESIYNKKLCN